MEASEVIKEGGWEIGWGGWSGRGGQAGWSGRIVGSWSGGWCCCALWMALAMNSRGGGGNNLPTTGGPTAGQLLGLGINWTNES